MTAVCLARQPIFDRDLKVVAYELLYRANEETTEAAVVGADDATSQRGAVVDGHTDTLSGRGLVDVICIDADSDGHASNAQTLQSL